MNITFSISSPGCGHITVAATSGGQTRTFCMQKTDLQLDPEDYLTSAITLLRYIAKTNNLNTLAQLKAEIEGKTYKI